MELSAAHLYNACHVLFGAEIDVSVDFLRYLQMPGLKAVYRKKALETHPDRALSLDCGSSELEEKFKEVNAAYRDLCDYLANPCKFRLIDERIPSRRKNPPEETRGRPGGRANRANSSGEAYRSRLYRGAIPKRELLFGQYVFYNGRISYRQLIDAIVWQKYQRPLIGTIALRWKWLYEDDIGEILHYRLSGEKFGESALRKGYLTPERLRMILAWQRLLQPRIGRYFVESKILPVSHVEDMVQQMRRHNRTYCTR